MRLQDQIELIMERIFGPKTITPYTYTVLTLAETGEPIITRHNGREGIFAEAMWDGQKWVSKGHLTPAKHSI